MKSAVLILPHLMEKNGDLGNETILRIESSVKIFNQKKLDYFITSGWDYRKDCKLRIGEVIADYLVEKHKIPKKKILIDTNSRDTVGDAFFIRENIILPYKIFELIVVTSNWHVNRSRIIFENFLKKLVSIKVVGSNKNLKNKKEIFNKEKLSTEAFYKTFSKVNLNNREDVYFTLKEKHPYYNGQVYSKLPSSK